MNIGRACGIFMNIDSDNFTEDEKLVAIRDVLKEMVTYNSITKDNILKAFRWFFDWAVEEASADSGEWKKTAEEKPDYTRHVIITYGSSRHASKYGYYFKKEDKWYRDHRCIEEIEPPYAWTEMPEVPEEFVCGMCCG